MSHSKLASLCDIDFTVNEFTVVRKIVYPPDPFTCKKGTLMFDRFFYVLRGSMQLNCSNSDFITVKPNEILYLPYDSEYTLTKWDETEDGEYISLNFVLRDNTGKIMSLENQIEIVATDADLNLLDRFIEINEIWTKGELGFRLKAKSILFGIIHDLALNAEKNSLKASHRKIYKSILYLENNYISAVTTAEISKKSNMNECTFRKLFKEATGMTPTQYRNTLRIKQAAKLLQTGEYNVIETMLLTGFNDPHYFNKVFKQQLGKNPSELIPR